MRKITISDGTDSVTLLTDLRFTIAPKMIGPTATMASGKIVMDKVGVKDTLTIPTGWLSPADLTKLRRMIDGGPELTISYPSLGGDKTAVFLVSQPEYKAFSYGADGVSQWYGVTLKAEQQGVG